MDREKLLLIVRASMAAAAAVVRLTPSLRDDQIYEIAALVVNQVLEIYSDGEIIDLEPAADQALAEAVFQIRAAI